MTPVRVLRVVAASALIAAFCIPVVGSGSPAEATDATTATPDFSAKQELTRTNLNADGSEFLVSKNTVTVTVDKTHQLHGRQDINVSWSGARPTGGIQPDVNSSAAADQEYPVAILECRGTDSPDVPVAQRVSPSTCWTHGADARFQTVGYTPVAAWRVDRYASAADRAAVVGRPTDVPSCPSATLNERWVPFVGIDGTTYNYGNNSCAGLPPEDYNYDSSAQVVPPNATFGQTTSAGTGSVKFDVWTEAENASLGCSSTVKCTLEVIPIVGLSCDPNGLSPVSAPLPPEDIASPSDLPRVTADCESTGSYNAGDLATISNSASLGVSGALWWSESNWRNRFTVPLDFAPVSHACDVVSAGAPVDVYGSELMTEATTQWAPQFCSDPSLFKLTHVQTSEPLARTLLTDPTSGVHAAFGSQSPPGGFPTATVQAPVAVTGFSISYNIDDVKGRSVTNLRLTPRLLAKLLTESYPADDFNRFKSGQFPYLGSNPINISDDPEFQALNPGISARNGTPGAATLVALATESDVTYALTSYINADPEAHAWLGGQPDPWGMVVNPAYKTDKLTLPITRWPLSDTTAPDFSGQVACQSQDPSPWLPLVASPTPNLAATAVAVQFSSPPSKTACKPVADIQNAPVQWASPGRSVPGQRFVIGVTSLGEAAHYDLQAAALQSQATVPNPNAKFSDGTGRVFVNPDDAGLKAAAAAFTKNAATDTWAVPYDVLRNSSAGENAYPGTMMVYADVPTSGLTASDASDYAKLLRFAVGPGQTPGSGNGQLPAGYLPMTTANGLGAEVDYTTRAAAAVEAQKGTVPALVPAPAEPLIGTTPPPATPADGFGTSTPALSAGSGSKITAPHSTVAKSSAATTSSAPALAAARPKTSSMSAGLAGLLLPTVLGGGLLAAFVSGGLLVRPRLPVYGRRRASGRRRR